MNERCDNQYRNQGNHIKVEFRALGDQGVRTCKVSKMTSRFLTWAAGPMVMLFQKLEHIGGGAGLRKIMLGFKHAWIKIPLVI